MYLQYILIRFTPSIALSHPPTFLLRAILTGSVVLFSYTSFFLFISHLLDSDHIQLCHLLALLPNDLILHSVTVPHSHGTECEVWIMTSLETVPNHDSAIIPADFRFCPCSFLLRAAHHSQAPACGSLHFPALPLSPFMGPLPWTLWHSGWVLWPMLLITFLQVLQTPGPSFCCTYQLIWSLNEPNSRHCLANYQAAEE
jgi:hypothetical protein